MRAARSSCTATYSIRRILKEAGVASTDTVVAVTDDDETNILASLLAKRHGARRAITLLNKGTYEPLTTTLGIDVVVAPRNITASTIRNTSGADGSMRCTRFARGSAS